MSQHDNGRRPGSSPWADQSPGRAGGQQGGHDDPGGWRGQQDQYGQGRSQQGDNWGERQGPAAGGWRPALGDGDRDWNAGGGGGGQGSFGGQAADNDYGNRGITESGNFGNYSPPHGNYGAMSGQGRYPGSDYRQGGNYDQGGQSGQRFGQYSHGVDARTDSTGGYGSGNFGPDNAFGSGGYGNGDWNQGSYGSRGGQSHGQRGQAYHDPDYHQWRSEQLSRLDRDYEEWRRHRYQRFSEDFDQWRANRDNNQGGAQGAAGNSGTAGASGQAGSQASVPGGTSGLQAGTSKHDVSSGGDADAGKTAM